jgi:hypothetical protein
VSTLFSADSLPRVRKYSPGPVRHSGLGMLPPIEYELLNNTTSTSAA